jgi:hypothetical protein
MRSGGPADTVRFRGVLFNLMREKTLTRMKKARRMIGWKAQQARRAPQIPVERPAAPAGWSVPPSARRRAGGDTLLWEILLMS